MDILLLTLAGVSVLLMAQNLSAQAPPPSSSESAQPGTGKTTRSIIALLQHGQDRCSRVGERLETYWQQLEGDPDHILQSLDHYVLTRASADLAGARKALDLARDLLTRAGSEVDAARREALEHVYDVDTSLCRTVAQPTPPLTEFHHQINLAESRIEQAIDSLGRLVRLPQRQTLLKDLESFQPMIDLASDEARDQMRKELEVRQPEEAAPPSSSDLMWAWHQDYARSVRNAKSALRDYLNGRKINDATAIQLACKDLLEAVIPLLTRDEIFSAPDPAVEAPLRAVYKAMRRLGNRCTAGRFVEADRAYEWLESSLGEAAEILATYSLAP